MNRGFLIDLIRAILVAIGYIMVFHFIAVAAYGRILSAGEEEGDGWGEVEGLARWDWSEAGKLFE